ncbi:peptidoglycan-binding domain-containing protein [Microtetraspora malaysiensis]|uniref:Peptidoglycan-binding protein n=1 Tax=Microtetraspora malaysiensis TaxID=161358 RepID=A0ABW6T3K3_9ACTN
MKAGAPRPGGGTSPATGGQVPAFPGRLLKYPPITRGDDVRRWQKQAKALGYQLNVDGAYGPASRAVCRKIQRAAGLGDDGIVGKLTWRATFAAKPK